MRLFFLISYFILWLSFPSVAQYFKPTYVKQAIQSWKKNATDSIKQCRLDSDIIRLKMKDKAKKLGHNEVLVFGPNDSFINEDMYLLFTEPPQAFNVSIDRKPDQIALENYHVALYWKDLSLYRWKKINSIMDSLIKQDIAPIEWTGTETIDNTEKISKKEAANILQSRIATSLYNELKIYFPYGNTLIPSQESVQKTAKPQLSIEQDSKNYNHFLVSSFPYQGQFNYYLDERVNRDGYVSFDRRFNDSIYQKLDRTYIFKIEWSDAKQYSHIEILQPKISYNQTTFEFIIPNTLLKEKVYRVKFYATNGKENINIWVNYFRVSKYGWVEKIKKIEKIASAYNYTTGSIELTIDEPFDYYETMAKNARQKLFKITTSRESNQHIDYVLNNSQISAYLSIPKITFVDTTNMANIPIDEKNHTANAPFIRRINLGNLVAYPAYSIGEISKLRFDTIKLNNIHIVPKEYVENAAIQGNTIAPMVTIDDFKKGEIAVAKTYDYEIIADHLKYQYQVRNLLKTAIEARVIARADFFYLLAVRAWKKGELKQKPRHEQFLIEERQNLTEHLKLILDDNYFHNNRLVKINIVKTDFSERLMAIWDIKIKQVKIN